MESDSVFLRKNKLIDYSLLVGIHFPNENNLRKSKTIINEPKNKDESKKNISSVENDPNNNLKIRRSHTKLDNIKIINKDRNLNVDEFIRSSNANFEEGPAEENSINESEISHYNKNNLSDLSDHNNHNEVGRNGFKEVSKFFLF